MTERVLIIGNQGYIGPVVARHLKSVHDGVFIAGYDIGRWTGADVVVHLIGERPGTGLNTLSAYVTYGRDAAGAPGVVGETRDGRTGRQAFFAPGKPSFSRCS